MEHQRHSLQHVSPFSNHASCCDPYVHDSPEPQQHLVRISEYLSIGPPKGCKRPDPEDGAYSTIGNGESTAREQTRKECLKGKFLLRLVELLSPAFSICMAKCHGVLASKEKDLAVTAPWGRPYSGSDRCGESQRIASVNATIAKYLGGY